MKCAISIRDTKFRNFTLPKFQVNFWWISPSPWSTQWPQNFETNLQKSSCWFEANGKVCLSNWIISPGRCENKKSLKPSRISSLLNLRKNHFKIPKWKGCFFPIWSYWWRLYSCFKRNCPTYRIPIKQHVPTHIHTHSYTFHTSGFFQHMWVQHVSLSVSLSCWHHKGCRSAFAKHFDKLPFHTMNNLGSLRPLSQYLPTSFGIRSASHGTCWKSNKGSIQSQPQQWTMYQKENPSTLPYICTVWSPKMGNFATRVMNLRLCWSSMLIKWTIAGMALVNDSEAVAKVTRFSYHYNFKQVERSTPLKTKIDIQHLQNWKDMLLPNHLFLGSSGHSIFPERRQCTERWMAEIRIPTTWGHDFFRLVANLVIKKNKKPGEKDAYWYSNRFSCYGIFTFTFCGFLW